VSLIPVAEALDRLFALVRPLTAGTVPLTQALGRVLARDVAARRDQPPFAASAMDGYAIDGTSLAPGQAYRVVGEAAAGRGLARRIAQGEAARIFTGAPMPEGTDTVLIQEDVTRVGDTITVLPTLGSGPNVRPLGADFTQGDTVTAPRRLRPADIALLAAMNIAEVPVTRRPRVAILATGDELVQPGETPGPDQIIASNSYGLHALATALGAAPRMLPIARDTLASLDFALGLVSDADLVLTIGGASVGDHDLVAQATSAKGMERSFYKVAMRPGKPLMAGRLGAAMMIGLPGNPVSAMVCGEIFVAPVLRAMQGLPAEPAPRETATLAAPLAANGPREHYLRAAIGPAGVTAFDKQDSSLLSVLSEADCLIVQPPHDGPRATGDRVEIIRI
jgi:molybdopterin molybdotransferase